MRRSTYTPAGAVLVLAAAALWLDSELREGLRDTTALTGWTLLVSFVVLAAYNLRKRVPFLPLLRSATWLRLHLAIGVLTIVFVLLHTSWRIPSGRFESLMALCYVLVAGSGLFGWWLSRRGARALANRGEEVIYERIPGLRVLLCEEAQRIVTEAVERRPDTPILACYGNSVLPCLLSGPRTFRDLGRQRRLHGRAIDAIDTERSFVSDADRDTLDRLEGVVRKRDDLDFHATLQGLLKAWFFVHVPLTWVLLVFSVFHVVLVHRFASSSV